MEPLTPTTRRGRRAANFRRRDCAIPTVWCGNGPVPKRRPKDGWYTGPGSLHRCLQKGFGAGKAASEQPRIPSGSVREIKYIGEYFEKRFCQKGIKSLNHLKKYAERKGPERLEIFLREILVSKRNVFNTKAYNSVLIYLDDEGVDLLPSCHNFREN